MAWDMYLQATRRPSIELNERDRRNLDMRHLLTASRYGVRLADLMLFDVSSLSAVTAVGTTYRNLSSDRASAVERFYRRLSPVLMALEWHSSAVQSLPRFGEFFKQIDWTYVELDTQEYRMNFLSSPSDIPEFPSECDFDLTLEWALQAIDLPAIATSGKLFGGPGRYSTSWEKLLTLFFVPPNHIYAGEEIALRASPWGAPCFSNSSSELLAKELYGRSFDDWAKDIHGFLLNPNRDAS